MSNNDITRLRPAEPQTAQPANDVSLPAVVELITAGLQQATAAMADDIQIEVSTHRDRNQTSSRFSFRALRKGTRVAGGDYNA
jgi:hypothetical protein